MLRVALCDDDPDILRQVREWLGDISDQMEIQIQTEDYSDGSQILAACKIRQPYDIIFMDVEMNEVNGLQAARQIRETDQYVKIIYISNHRDYALESFEANPFHYLMKPLSKEQFCAVFERAYEAVLTWKYDFIYTTERKDIHLPIREILYFQSCDKKVEAVFAGKVQEFRARLDDVEKKLEHSSYPFIRIHKSYLVNYLHIKAKTPDEITLSSGMTLQISRKMREQVSIRYGDLVCRLKGH